MQTYEQFADVDVLGANLQSIVDGFGTFSILGNGILFQEGLGNRGRDDSISFEKDKWYPLATFLRAFDRIGKDFGEYMHRQVGLSIPKNAPFPPTVVDIDTAIQSIDVAYHMNHGVNGVALFSPATGKKTDRIGNYGYERQVGKKLILSKCSTPYPCAFDEGILTSMAQRFDRTSSVTHAPGSCRKKGAAFCIYHIAWK
ncbi:hypothetical protein [Melittangium boletus]|uniref:4-vinyl reductase 4VR domain-containing protein n=1 Tax=Melittangium boletus DSM 14713 TaxID=1294270 RepID=A0A250INQ4_9BACT|nr:hypothetical protein [Melittangium boletus]ATB33374.1 hypothetical protein MEBOL_006866 [Melittangium boletus DSM 14713]